MATLRILVPDGTTNYVKNPSMRFDATGWTAAGSTLTRTLTRARFGISALQVVTNGSALNEGAYYRVSNLTNVNDPITVSAYVRGTGRVRIRVISSLGGSQAFSKDVDLLADRWTRIYATGRHNGSNDIRVYVETNGAAAQARTFYVDGVQMEVKPYPTTYIDGEQPGCRWHGVSHNSISIRDPYTRAGGRWVTIGGPEREAQDLYMTVVGGLGVAPMTNNVQSYADSPGSYFQNQKIFARTITLTFFAKHVDLLGEKPVSLQNLHQLRQMLIDIIKPDRTAGGEEFLMEYQDGDKPLYFSARYDGGLDGEWDIRNQWINSFPLRLLAVSPFLAEDSQEVASLDFQNWESNMNRVIQRVDGEWKMMNYGFDNLVYSVELGRRGEVFAGGGFTHANNNALAIDPLIFANCIAYFDGDQWQRVSTGALGVGNSVRAVALAPNGDIYIGGIFTSVGGVAANNIAKWNGTTWSALGSGLNGTVLAVEVAPNGDIYVGGGFTTAGGIPASCLARWDGGSWHSMGISGGLNSSVSALSISPDGLSVYVGGFFTDEFGASADNLLRIAIYDVATNSFEAIGDGFDAEVWDIKLSDSGLLYAGGIFTLSGLQSVPHVAVWNGSIWQPLGSGMETTGEVYSIDLAPNGDLMALGNFTEAGGLDTKNGALWNGSTWVSLDIIPNGVWLDGLFNPDNGNVYLSGEGNTTTGDSNAIFSGVTLVDNAGTAEVSPVIYVLGQGTLRRIENWTTKKRMFLELDILDDEEVFIDFGRAQIRSTVRGDLSHRILSGSDFKAFTLIPGENKIITFMTNDVDAYMQISYQPLHWGADATAPIEEL